LLLELLLAFLLATRHTMVVGIIFDLQEMV